MGNAICVRGFNVVCFRLFDQCDSCVNLPKAAMTFGKGMRNRDYFVPSQHGKGF